MRILIIFVLLIVGITAESQTIVIKDRLSHQPLELVTAVSLNPKTYATSNSKGQLNLESFAGSDSITFQVLGYKIAHASYDSLSALLNQTLFLDREAFSIDGVTVSAARWKQAKRDIPNKITTISPEEIYFENPQTAADLLGRSGEVYVQKSQLGGGSPMIRGFATNRVMLSVDGIRMNNAIFRSGNIQNVISIDPLSVENTEIIFGPGSVIYGSDAIGGVMSFYTLTPDLSTSEEPIVAGNAFVRGSTANLERTGHLDFNLGFEKWAFLSSISYSDYGDLEMGSNGPNEYLRPEYVVTDSNGDRIVKNKNARIQNPTAYNQVNVMQKIRFKPNRFWDFQYGGHYSATSSYGRYDRLIRYNGNTLQSAEWYYGPQEWMMHSAHAVNERPTVIYDKMSITAAYQYFKESRHDRDFGSSIRTNQTERVYAGSLNADFEQDIGARHEVFYGLEAIYNLVESRSTIKNINSGSTALAQSRYPNGSSWFSAATYFSDRFKLNDKVTILSGIRYSIVQIQAKFDTSFLSLPVRSTELLMDALNGSTGLAYHPNSKWQFNVNLSTGFRAPNIDDVGKVFDSEPGSVVVPNPDLSPEYAYSAEIGLVKVFKEFLKADLSCFYTYLNNALVRRNFTLNGSDSLLYKSQDSRIQAIQNASFAMVYGVQTGFELKLPKGFAVASRFNWQQGEEELDNGSTAPLRHAPPIFGFAKATYTRDRLRSEISMIYNGEVRNADLAPSEQSKDYLYALNNNGLPYSPSWQVFNAKASYQVKDYFLVSAGVENILDVRYRPYSSGLSAPGRNFIGSLKYSF